MAATAKRDGRSKFSGEATGEEDIAAIAKQISDHAEVIYQTWKSRGLAPTEILNCHNNASAVDKFESVLSPITSSSGGGTMKRSSQLDELNFSNETADNNNLEKLVNNFVEEDRARLKSDNNDKKKKREKLGTGKNLPSSIKFVLDKFEHNSFYQNKDNSIRSLNSDNIKRSQGHDIIKMGKGNLFDEITGKEERRRSLNCEFDNLSELRGGGRRWDSLNLQSWPFKNKISQYFKKSRGNNEYDEEEEEEGEEEEEEEEEEEKSGGENSLYLKEVAREEKRLIDALKTGSVINDDNDDDVDERRSSLSTITSDYLDYSEPKISNLNTNVANLNTTSLSSLNTNLVSSKSLNLKKIDLCNDNLSSVSLVDFISKNKIQQPKPKSRFSNYLDGTSSFKLNKKTTEEEMMMKKKSPKNKEDDITAEKFKEFYSMKSWRSDEKIDLSTSKKNNSILLSSSAKVKIETDIEKSSKIKKDDSRVGIDLLFPVNMTSNNKIVVNTSRQRIEQVPHPELTIQQRQHIKSAANTVVVNNGNNNNNNNNNPVRPFLTRGSVAERVLIFEKCPSELLLDKRRPRFMSGNNNRRGGESLDGNNKVQMIETHGVEQRNNRPPHTTLQRHVKANKNVEIPRFYFPEGKPVPHTQMDATVAGIVAAFKLLPGQRASRSDFHIIAKACDLPLYWKVPLFLATRYDQTEFVELNSFIEFWKELTKNHHDAASKFVRIITRGLRRWILPEDLIPLVQDVVETHPGLTFLKEAVEFHSRYVHTVIARIFYCVNRSWSGKISVAELRRSHLLSTIGLLEEEEDINKITSFFSYEHFYVIYCKFWELDRDHDLFIDKMDLMRHNNHALSSRMFERIFSGAVTRGNSKNANGIRETDDKMSYTEFVWFLLSEEDKNHPTAIEYWFRCMDLDGDGYLSMYELNYFYEEEVLRMDAMGIEALAFEDCLCQMLDMINPAIPDKISLSDLKKCKMTTIFFDTFFNLEKYLAHERRDPFASVREQDADGQELSDWDRFAAEEYELLVVEENLTDQTDQMLHEAMMDDEYVSEQESNTELNSLKTGAKSLNELESRHLEQPDQPKAVYCDSCDSDDYAESDN